MHLQSSKILQHNLNISREPSDHDRQSPTSNNTHNNIDTNHRYFPNGPTAIQEHSLRNFLPDAVQRGILPAHSGMSRDNLYNMYMTNSTHNFGMPGHSSFERNSFLAQNSLVLTRPNDHFDNDSLSTSHESLQTQLPKNGYTNHHDSFR